MVPGRLASTVLWLTDGRSTGPDRSPGWLLCQFKRLGYHAGVDRILALSRSFAGNPCSPLPMIYGLPRSCFVCPELYQREQARIFGRTWICCGRVPGQDAAPAADAPWTQVCLAGHSVIVVRDPDRGVRAYHNVCRHRGTRLLEEGSGTLKNGCITCPYHAWTFDTAGRLVGAPNMQGVTDFNREEHGLLPVRCATWGGYVFLCLDDEAPAFETFASPLSARLENWQVGNLQLAGRCTYDVQANWKLLFQNYSECYHCPTVHPDLNQVTPFRTATNDLGEGPILGGPMGLADGFHTVTRDGSPVGRPFGHLSELQQRSVFYYTVFPGMFVSAHPDYVMIHHIQPQGVGQSRVVCEFLTDAGTDPADARPAIEMWDEVNRQDWRVCELTQQGAQSPAFRPGPYSGLEPMLAAFDRHYRHVMDLPEATGEATAP